MPKFIARVLFTCLVQENIIFHHIMLLVVAVHMSFVLYKRKSLEVDLRLIAKKKNSCWYDLMLNVPVNSYGHVGTIAVERNIKQ